MYKEFCWVVKGRMRSQIPTSSWSLKFKVNSAQIFSPCPKIFFFFSFSLFTWPHYCLVFTHIPSPMHKHKRKQTYYTYQGILVLITVCTGIYRLKAPQQQAQPKQEKPDPQPSENSTSEVTSQLHWSTTQKETRLRGRLKSRSWITTITCPCSLMDSVRLNIRMNFLPDRASMTC